MTVAELRRALAQFPDDTEVMVLEVPIMNLVWMRWSGRHGWDHVGVVLSGMTVKIEQLPDTDRQ